MWGEDIIVMAYAPGLVRGSNARAMNYAECLITDWEMLEQACAAFPLSRKHIKRCALRLAMRRELVRLSRLVMRERTRKHKTIHRMLSDATNSAGIEEVALQQQLIQIRRGATHGSVLGAATNGSGSVSDIANEAPNDDDAEVPAGTIVDNITMGQASSWWGVGRAAAPAVDEATPTLLQAGVSTTGTDVGVGIGPGRSTRERGAVERPQVDGTLVEGTMPVLGKKGRSVSFGSPDEVPAVLALAGTSAAASTDRAIAASIASPVSAAVSSAFAAVSAAAAAPPIVERATAQPSAQEMLAEMQRLRATVKAVVDEQAKHAAALREVSSALTAQTSVLQQVLRRAPSYDAMSA